MQSSLDQTQRASPYSSLQAPRMFSQQKLVDFNLTLDQDSILCALYASPQRLLGSRRYVPLTIPNTNPKFPYFSLAEEFDPDRFIDERVHKYLTPNPFIFLPFNAGPRICLGQQFAYNEMSFFLIKLVQNFASIDFDAESFEPSARPRAEWKSAEGRKGYEKFWPRSHLTLYSKVRRMMLLCLNSASSLSFFDTSTVAGMLC
jgi:hypothetical protein